MQLNDKTAIITGGGGGIGASLCSLLTNEGMRVFALDVQQPMQLKEGVTYLTTDVTDPSSIEAALKNINGSIDLLVNNAGVMRRGEIMESTPEDFDLVMNVNVKGSWLMLKLAEKRLSPDAVIVQMLSRHALFPPQDPALYTLSKISVDRMLDLFVQTHPKHSVKRIYPGPTDTALARHGVTGQELKEKERKMFKPDDLAAEIVELLKNDKEKLMFDPESWSHKIV